MNTTAKKTTSYSFSAREAVTYAWNIIKTNPKAFILAALLASIPTIIDSIPDLIRYLQVFHFQLNDMQSPNDFPLWITICLVIASFILSSIFSIGIIKFSLEVIDKKNIDPLRILNVTKREFFQYSLASLLYFLIVLGGTLLFIIPGIIWGIKYQMYPYLILEKNMSALEALKKSATITQGNKWNLWRFSFLLMLVVLAGLIALGVGLLIAIPLTWIAEAFVYRKLSGSISLVAVTPSTTKTAI